MYKVPDKHFFRLHQVRPRFKTDVESVLLYMSNQIVRLEPGACADFNTELSKSIRLFPGNATKKPKTIENWRTEISALFGLVVEDSQNDIVYPGELAKILSESEDLVQFFKYFLFNFQYPGGHIKSHKLKAVIDEGIKFKPAQYILRVLSAGEDFYGDRFGINKAEATHLIYNDLQVTRDNTEPQNVAEKMVENRFKKVSYDWRGDVVRYAGDILDYLTIADLLVQHGNMYYINWNDRESVTSFLESDRWFAGYDRFFQTDFDVSELHFIEPDWFAFINSDLSDEMFKTDLLKYLGVEADGYETLVQGAIEEFEKDFKGAATHTTKDIGDFGESLVLGHECMRVTNGGRKDLIHLIKKIPTALAVGYDIQSIELNEIKRYIEVKSTVSRKPLTVYNFHLTRNEWGSAQTLKDTYYVYRLMISKEQKKLFLLQDPVQKYKDDLINMTIRDGADVTFSDKSGEWEELLLWKK
jgi:hypothetical protein